MNKNDKNKIKNGGIYWIDFKEFKKPEWGNNKKGNPHLAILIRINDFENKEMYLALPLTSKKVFLEKYGEKVVKEITIINNGNRKSNYILLNQLRTISKNRVKNHSKYYIDNVANEIEEIYKSFNNFIFYYFNDLKLKYPNKYLPIIILKQNNFLPMIV